MTKKSFSLLATLALLAVLCGCIEHSETIYNNPERVKVEFENDAAARIFYEALSKTHTPAEKRESNTSVEIPVVFEHHRKVVEGENVAFNKAVQECDTN